MAATPGLPAGYDLYHRRGVQKALNEKTSPNPSLIVDGAFGAKSIAALQVYQSANNLVADGNYGPLTQALLEPFIASKYILMANYQQAASQLGVLLAAIQANVEAESGGSGFFPNGTCKIRFERHQMYNMLVQQKGQATANGLVNRYPSVVNPVPGGYAANPYDQLNLALTIDQTCAMLATSWGLFQIMGFNFKEAGYATVQAYVADVKISEGKQLTQYINFIKTYRQGALWTALKNCDWVTFATIYNGPAQVASYSKTMGGFFTSFTANPNG